MNNSQQKTKDQLLAEDLERLEDFRLLDDTYARTYFRNEPKLAEFVLRIVTGIKDLSLDPSEYETQYDAKRLAGSRSLIMDVHGGDSSGRKYDLEVENWDAEPPRAEYHVATMCMEHLPSGSDFDDLPEIYVIFFCGNDAVGNGRPINQFSYRNDDIDIEGEQATHQELKGRTHIIYVNGKYENASSEIGKLIHDFNCRKASDMLFKNLADRTRYLKETEEGRQTMCRVMDEMIQENIKETSIRIAKNLIELGENSHEDIAKVTGLTLEEVKKLAGQAAS